MEEKTLNFSFDKERLIITPENNWPSRIELSRDQLQSFLEELKKTDAERHILDYKIVSACISDRGLNARRKVNEDRCLMMPEKGVFVVADGVGGHSAGEIASEIAVRTIQSEFENNETNLQPEDQKTFLAACIQRANDKIVAEAKANNKLFGMLTTIAVLRIFNNSAIVAHIGDSRVYRIRRGMIEQLTRDHSKIQELIDAGELLAHEAHGTGDKHIITKALGMAESAETDFSSFDVAAEDCFLLTTDGVTDNISDEELLQIVEECRDLHQMCERVKDRCYQAGANDNLTFMVVKLTPTEALKPNNTLDEDEISTKIKAAERKGDR